MTSRLYLIYMNGTFIMKKADTLLMRQHMKTVTVVTSKSNPSLWIHEFPNTDPFRFLRTAQARIANVARNKK